MDVHFNNDILHWTTANEFNTASFIIEQSTDGNIFKTAGQVKAALNSSLNKEYIFTQNSTLNAGGFYRLKMVDVNNSFTYSPVISLKHEDASVLKIVYQAGYKSIVINNQTNATCRWQLYSANGYLTGRGNSSNTSINIPVSNAFRGTYVLICKAKDVTRTLKFVVE